MKIRTTAHSAGRTADGRSFSYLADREVDAVDADHEALLRSFLRAGTAIELGKTKSDDEPDPPVVPKAAATVRTPGTRA